MADPRKLDLALSEQSVFFFLPPQQEFKAAAPLIDPAKPHNGIDSSKPAREAIADG